MDGHAVSRSELVQRWSVHRARQRTMDERSLGGLEARERFDWRDWEFVRKCPVLSRASCWRCRCEVALPRNVHERSPRKKFHGKGTFTGAEA